LTVAPEKPLSVSLARVADPATVNSTTVRLTLQDSRTPIEGTVSVSETEVRFEPRTVLALNTRYTLLVTTGVKDSSGQPLLANDFSSTFTTRDGVWTEPEWVGSRGGIPADFHLQESGASVDVDPQGNAVVAWVGQEAGAAYPTHVYARRFDRAAAAWGPPTLLAARQDASVYVPQVVAAANGDFGIYWEDYIRSATEPPAWWRAGSIWGARYLASRGGWQQGTQWAGDYSSNGVCCQRSRLVLEPDGNGTFLFTSTERFAGGFTKRVRAHALMADGSLGAVTTLLRVDNYTDPALGNDKFDTALLGMPLAMADDGRTYVYTFANDYNVDTLLHPRGYTRRCYLHRYTPGQGWTAPERVQDSGYEDTCSVSDIRVNAKGQILAYSPLGPSLARSPGTNPGGTESWTRLFDPQSGWSDSVRVNAEPNEDARGTMMDIDDEGNAMLLWIGYDLTDPSVSALRYARYQPGAGWSAPQRVDFQSALPAGYGVATTYFKFDRQGNGLAVFQLVDGSRPDPVLADRNLYTGFAAVRYLKGLGWQRPHVITTDRTANTWYRPTFGLDAAGRAVLAWGEIREGGQWGVRVARFE
jgi:hypothetical protein